MILVTMTRLDVKTGEIPMPNTLCVFRFWHDPNDFMLGYIFFNESLREYRVKKYRTYEFYADYYFSHYQYVSNPKDRFFHVSL